ncbi:MAG: DUF4012 domain-containing protein [Pseudoclavibacter caeni]|jgi:hypothetical protein
MGTLEGMTHALETDAMPHPRRDRRDRRARRTRRRWPWIILAVVVVLIAALVVIGVQVIRHAFATRDDLQQAKAQLSLVGDRYQSGDRSGAQHAYDQARALAGSARDETSGMSWTIGTAAPALGANLAAVRTVADQTAGLLDDAAPLAGRILAMDPDQLVHDGALDMDGLETIIDDLPALDTRLSDARDELGAIDTDPLISQVGDGVGELRDQIDGLQPTVRQAASLGSLLPGVLGADGPKNYLLLFQNNAEVRSLGGNPASLMLLRVEDGRLEIADQKDSGSFNNNYGGAHPNAIAELPDGAYIVFIPNVSRFEMDMTGFPDLPTVAAMAKGWWTEAGGTAQIDGVLTFDPVGLSYLLRATGPVTMPNGDVLTSDNVVKTVLSDVYARYPLPAAQDAYFASAAASVFNALTTQKVDSGEMIAALSQSIDERRLLFWSADAQVQQALSVSPELQGVIPDDGSGDDGATRMAVYLWDTTGSKIDYHVTNSDVARRYTCSADGSTTYTVDVTLTSTITPEEAQQLPEYVLPDGPKSNQRFGTDIYAFGPSGSRFTGMEVLRGGLEQSVSQQGETLGRPGVRVATQMAFGTTTTVRLTFVADGVQDESPLDLLTTPMVHPVEASTETLDHCAS